MIEEKIKELIVPLIEKMGYSLVQARILGDGKYKTLQVMAEKNDGTALMLGDLQTISKNISNLLDETNIFESRYNLEISSPGLDRPLVKFKDYQNNVGSLINIRLLRANDKGRKFKGFIISVNENGLIFKPENFAENFEIEFSNIDSAKLVITDEMFGKGKKRKF